MADTVTRETIEECARWQTQDKISMLNGIAVLFIALGVVVAIGIVLSKLPALGVALALVVIGLVLVAVAEWLRVKTGRKP